VYGLVSKSPIGRVSITEALTRSLLANLVCTGALLWPAMGAETAKTPNFAPDSLTGWQTLDDDFIPPPSGPGPVVSDPAHPYISFYRFPRNPKPSFRVADLSNPILQPWAREHLRMDRGALSEVVCAENNDDHFHHGIEPMPQADKPDF